MHSKPRFYAILSKRGGFFTHAIWLDSSFLLANQIIYSAFAENGWGLSAGNLLVVLDIGCYCGLRTAVLGNLLGRGIKWSCRQNEVVGFIRYSFWWRYGNWNWFHDKSVRYVHWKAVLACWFGKKWNEHHGKFFYKVYYSKSLMSGWFGTFWMQPMEFEYCWTCHDNADRVLVSAQGMFQSFYRVVWLWKLTCRVQLRSNSILHLFCYMRWKILR